VSRSDPGGRNHWSMKYLMVDGDGLMGERSREAKAVATSRGGALSGMSLWYEDCERNGLFLGLKLQRVEYLGVRCAVTLTLWFYCREIDVMCELIGKDGITLGVSLLPSFFFDGCYDIKRTMYARDDSYN